MPELQLIIIISTIIFLSSLVRGSTGFGLAMTAMPLISIFLPYAQAIILVVLINLAFSVLHLSKTRGKLLVGGIIWIIVFGIIGVTVGVLIFNRINQEILKAIAGFIIVLFAISEFIGFRMQIKNMKFAFSFASFSGGILAGCASIGGPAAVMILGGTKLSTSSFRYAMSVFFLVTYSYATMMHGAGGNIGKEELILFSIMIPFMAAGLFIGEKIIAKVDKVKFRKVVLLILIVAGSVISFQSLKVLIS